MEYKLLTPEFKLSEDGPGGFGGYTSTFANWDEVRERPVKGAFLPHLAAFLKDGFIAIGHDWQSLPIATPTEAKEDDYGLFVGAQFHTTDDAQKARTVVRERLDRGKSVKLSIGYEVLDDEYTQEGRLLKEIKLYEFSLVTVPANPLAAVTGAKSGLTTDQEHRAVLAAVKSYIEREQSIRSLRAKEGRVLSAATRNRVKAAYDSLISLAAELETLLAETEPQQDTAAKAKQVFLEYLRVQAAINGAVPL